MAGFKLHNPGCPCNDICYGVIDLRNDQYCMNSALDPHPKTFSRVVDGTYSTGRLQANSSIYATGKCIRGHDGYTRQTAHITQIKPGDEPFIGFKNETGTDLFTCIRWGIVEDAITNLATFTATAYNITDEADPYTPTGNIIDGPTDIQIRRVVAGSPLYGMFVSIFRNAQTGIFYSWIPYRIATGDTTPPSVFGTPGWSTGVNAVLANDYGVLGGDLEAFSEPIIGVGNVAPCGAIDYITIQTWHLAHCECLGNTGNESEQRLANKSPGIYIVTLANMSNALLNGTYNVGVYPQVDLCYGYRAYTDQTGGVLASLSLYVTYDEDDDETTLTLVSWHGGFTSFQIVLDGDVDARSVDEDLSRISGGVGGETCHVAGLI